MRLDYGTVKYCVSHNSHPLSIFDCTTYPIINPRSISNIQFLHSFLFHGVVLILLSCSTSKDVLSLQIRTKLQSIRAKCPIDSSQNCPRQLPRFSYFPITLLNQPSYFSLFKKYSAVLRWYNHIYHHAKRCSTLRIIFTLKCVIRELCEIVECG